MAKIGKSANPKNLADASPITFEIWESTGYLINVMARLMAKALHHRIMQEGIPIGQWPFLLALWEEEGISQTLLSRKVGVDAATTVRTLDRMERDALVKRERDANDRRQINIFLTTRGRELRVKLIPHAVAVNQLATQSFHQDEIRTLHDLLKRIISNISQDADRINDLPKTQHNGFLF
ncbi:MAG: MarR family winged helix-turn-helix transcriptional regulator [Gammaproteobacteria bacterium]|nr:MarR family winged helix-turn-helix transcriptional regulator [Gammaproteobacteria bacterium]